MCVLQKIYLLMFLVQETCKFVLLKEPIYHCCKTGKLAPFLGSVVSLNRSRLIKSRLLVTFKCLYNAASLSRFTFCFSRKVDVASVVYPACIWCTVIIIIFVSNQCNGFFINKPRIIHFIFSDHFLFSGCT